MRNAVVILLWLCIGLALGFIVPSSDTKINIINNTLPMKIIKKGTKEIARNTLPISTTIHTQQASELPINRTKIDEKALYEHATASENVQNERALIYINQKYRKPSLHQFYRLMQNGQDLSRRFNDPPIMPQDIIHCLNKPCKLNRSSVHAYFTQLDLLDQPANLGLQFEASNMYKNKLKGAVSSKTNAKERAITKSKGELDNNVFNSHSVSSRKNMINKVVHENAPDQMTTSNYENFIKHFKRLYKESNVVQEKHKDMWKNFGFEIPNANVGYYPKTMLNKVQSPKNFEENRMKKYNAQRFPENTADYYKLVRIYNNMQNMMTDQKNVTNTNRLSPCDCSRKTSLSFDFSTEGYRQKRCKCKRNRKTKPNCSIEKERHESAEMNTLLSPSDMSFYKDFLY